MPTIEEGELVENRDYTPEELVEYYAELYGADASLAKRIIKCESEWVVDARNPHSSAEGLAQFINSTWFSTMKRMGKPTSTSKFSVVDHVQAFIYLLSEDGTGHWEESRNCWKRL